MAVTIKDIAKIAGVTHSTVSRCLNDRPGVSDAMRLKIKQIAQDLEFEFNANARGLNTSKTGTIGVIVNEDDADGQPHIFTNTFLRHIRQQLEEHDLDTLTTFSHNNFSGKDNILKLVNRRKVDGLIILSNNIGIDSIRFLHENRFPFIYAHQVPPETAEAVNAVYCDHFRGGYLAAKHLLDRGHKRLLCLARRDNRAEFRLRTEGFMSALAEAGIPFDETDIVPVEGFLHSGPGIIELIQPLLKNHDAVFAHTDLIALVVMKELLKLGYRIPDDVAIAGYDNIELCSFFEPNLTTIAQPAKKISIQTCNSLIKILSGRTGHTRIIIQPELVVRDST